MITTFTKDVETNDNCETTHFNTSTVTTAPNAANGEEEPYYGGNDYWEAFETSLQPTMEQPTDGSMDSNNGTEDAPPVVSRWARPRRRRRGRSVERGSSHSADMLAPRSAHPFHQSVEIAFASHPYCQPNDHINTRSPTTMITANETAAATLLRRIRSTGDVPNCSTTDLAIVWHDEDDSQQRTVNDITALCRSPSQSPLAVLLGNWNNHEATTNDNDDVSQASSAQYFEPDDYDPWWWHESLVRHPPATVGVAVVALAAMLTHPVVFIAAAVAAWGSVAAAHQGYHYYWNNNNNNTDNDDMKSSWNNSLFCFGSTVTPATTLDAPLAAAPTKTPEQIQINANDEEQNKPKLMLAAASSKDDENPTTAASARTQTQQQQPDLSTTTTASTQQQPQKEQQRQHQQDWMDLHYPPLKHTVVQNGGHLVGINCVEFFHVFFDDDAVYSFKEFQRQRHDRNIEYGAWKDVVVPSPPPPPQQGVPALDNDNNNHNDDDDDSNDPAISLAPGGATRPSIATGLAACGKYRLFRGRTLSFQAKTNSFLGPPYANTVKKQRMLIVNARLAILESRTRLSGIPFGDRFRVMERWIVTASKVDGRYVAQVASASCEVVFDPTALCPWEQQIKHKSATTIRDIVTAWCVMATEALQRTEQAKLSRRKRKHQAQRSALNHGDDDDETTLDGDTSSSHQTNGDHDPSTDNDDDPDVDKLEDDEHHVSVEVVARQRNDDASDGHHTFYLSTTPTTTQSTRKSWLHRSSTTRTHSWDP